MKRQGNIFTDLLSVLHVPFTPDYSTERFMNMPFKTLFGLSKLLEEYNVDSKGYNVASVSSLISLPMPFIAETSGGLILVTSINSGNNTVSYLSDGMKEQMSVEEFDKVATGNIFIAFPTDKSEEPDYASHRRTVFFSQAKSWFLIGLIGALVLYLWITNDLYDKVSVYFIAAFDVIGLYLSTLLLQKTLKIHNPAADRVCSVIEEGGCDNVLKTDASSFFGIFSWSEVGFSYFLVSLLALLIFPQYIGYLALCNIFCLPFSFWSVWYQKYRAKSWCTLCLGVQATLWILGGCYLLGGWWEDIFPIEIQFPVLVASYALTLLIINRISTKYENTEVQ